MMGNSLKPILRATTVGAFVFVGIGQALAQDVSPQVSPASARANDVFADIVVTARKRQESLLNVPIIETVIPAQQLQRLGTTDLKDLTKLAPGLLIGTAVLSIGQLVSIRGVGTSSLDPGIDQSVSLTIDGLSLGQGLAYSSGLFDVEQVEVLKGPQALFFGKSSPGGVISIRTADPTDKFEVIARAGYEAEGHTRRGELVVSGPITDELKARIAGMYSASKGYYFNEAIPAPGTGALAPRYPREGRSRDYQIRATVVWDPSSKFSARLKANLAHDSTINAENFQLTSCPDGVSAPLGIPFIGGGEDCRKDRVARIVDMNPANYPGILNGGTPFVTVLQRFGTAELNYNFTPQLTATSVTGYYNLHSSNQLNTSNTVYAGPAFGVINPKFRRRDFTQEVRLNSDYDYPLNFTMGAFYQDGKVSDRIVLIGNSAYLFPPLLADGVNAFTIKTYSAFLQGRGQITPQLELAVGARYTDETRRQTQTLFGAAIASPVPRIHSGKLSPELTLTYKPSDDLTVFGAFKRGNKSGSFSIATPAKTVPLDNSFNDETVTGFEGGIKGRLLDRQLNFSLSAYDYKYKGLQVGAVEPTVGAVPTIRTVNAGSGKAYGAELELGFRPRSVPGLSLNSSVAWNHARFGSLNNVPCYGGQTVAQGCNQQPDPISGLFFAQDLSGSRFIRAPNWQATVGFDYELPISGETKIVLANSNHYSSRYLTNLGTREDYFQNKFVKSDLSLSLIGPDNKWEVAVIGKNITAHYTASQCSNSNFAGGLIGGQITGGATSGPAGIDEVGCYMDPGRSLWLRITLRPFG